LKRLTWLIVAALGFVLTVSCQPSLPVQTAIPPPTVIVSPANIAALLPGVVETATALAQAALVSPTPSPPPSATPRPSRTPQATPSPAPPTETLTPVPTATAIVMVDESVPGCRAQHVVQRGEWLGLIARNYDVPLAELALANGLSNTNLLVAGQVLCIPAAGSAVLPPDATTAPGDNLAILSFTAGPDPVERGSVVRLRWAVRSADSVAVWRLAFDRKLNQWHRTGEPAYRGMGSGELTLPVALDARQPPRFELEANNALSQTVSRQSPPIQLACYPLFHRAASGGAACPHLPVTVPAELQIFEHGYMLWRSDSEEIYVLILRPDQYIFWTVAIPTGLPVEAGPIPAGFFAPAMQFTEVWATLDSASLGGTGRLADVLGWAVAPAQPYQLTAQTALDPLYAMFDQLYLSWPDGRVVQLYTGGGLPRPGMAGPAWSFISP
jgi:LysM repeat protein